MKQGLLGTLIVVLLGVVGGLWRSFTGSTDKRLDDSKTFQDRYVQLLEKTLSAQRDATTVLEVIKEKLK